MYLVCAKQAAQISQLPPICLFAIITKVLENIIDIVFMQNLVIITGTWMPCFARSTAPDLTTNMELNSSVEVRLQSSI